MSKVRILEAVAGRVTVFAPGKVNLYLRVGAVPVATQEKRHQLLTVFQCLDLGETLRLIPRGQDGILSPSDEVHTTLAPGLTAPLNLDGEDNLVRLALTALREASGVDFPSTKVEVTKRIPVAGGMAGGSADCAATLVGANALYELGLPPAALEEIGAALGADVPAILRGGNALGRRFGDKMTSLPLGPKRYWVFAVSAVGLSTPEVFKQFDRINPQPAKLPENVPLDVSKALEEPASELAAVLHNDLEAPAFSLRPELREIKAAAERNGALRAIVSGSGPTMACLCEDANAAENLRRHLQNNPAVKLAVAATG